MIDNYISRKNMINGNPPIQKTVAPKPQILNNILIIRAAEIPQELFICLINTKCHGFLSKVSG